MADSAERPAAEVKPGTQTTEFWTTVGVIAGSLLTHAPPAVKVIVTAAVAIAYGVGRVVLKLRTRP